MSHFHYVLIFLLASSFMAALLHAEDRSEWFSHFVRRFLTPLGTFVGVSWVMFLLGNL